LAPAFPFRPGALVRLMTADDAACCGSKYAVVSGAVAGDTADQCAFQTAFGLSRNGSAKCKRNRGASDQCFHGTASRLISGDQRQMLEKVPLGRVVPRWSALSNLA
jgi:hypothetical protein